MRPGRATRRRCSTACAEAGRRDAAIADLHALLLRGAHHELARRATSGAPLARRARRPRDAGGRRRPDGVLAKLHTFRGASRFTTWAYKFVLLEAGVKARRRAWEGREVALEDESWRGSPTPPRARSRRSRSRSAGAIARAVQPRSRRTSVGLRGARAQRRADRRARRTPQRARAARSIRPCTTPGESSASRSPTPAPTRRPDGRWGVSASPPDPS